MLGFGNEAALKRLVPILIIALLLGPWLGAISAGLAIGVTLCLAMQRKSTT